MATAYNLTQRESVIKLHDSGINMLQISIREGINYGTVKTLIKRHKAEGVKGLTTLYHQCGRKRTYNSELTYRLVRLYKFRHPLWGVEYILMKIREKYPDLPLSVARVYERRLKSAHLLTMPRNPPLQHTYHPERSLLPHDTWQIDAKERLITSDGQAACYLTTTDEKTGGALSAKVFPLQPYQSGAFGRHTRIFVDDVR